MFFLYENSNQIMSKFCTYHDSFAVVACAKLWHNWLIKFQIIVEINFTWFRYQLLWSRSPISVLMFPEAVTRAMVTGFQAHTQTAPKYWHTKIITLHLTCGRNAKWRGNFCDNSLQFVALLDLLVTHVCSNHLQWVAVMPHERCGVSNQRQRDCLFNRFMRGLHYWHFVRGSTDHRWITIPKGQLHEERFHDMA